MKNNTKRISQFLEELYVLDSSLKKYEKELKKIINHILRSKPNTQFDEEFKERLRSEIMTRIQELKEKKEKTFNFSSVFSFGTPTYALAGALVVVLIVGGVYLSQKSTSPTLDFEGLFTINSLENNAFGDFNADEANLQTEGVGAGAPSAGSEAAELTDSKEIGGGGGGQAIGMPAPEWTTYKYIYEGDNINFNEEFVQVLRRQKNTKAGSQLAKIVGSSNMELLDISNLANSKVEMISISEDKDRGYTVHLNFQEGQVSIYKNWRRWESPARCIGILGARCGEYEPLKLGDIPGDEVLVKIANDFLRKYKIDVAIYGQPEINKDWQVFSQQTDSKYANIPEEIQVVYPLLINGKKTYESHGPLASITVGIDIRNNIVASVYNLTTQNYDQSSYKAANASEILKATEAGGGINTYYSSQNSGNIVEIRLGTPERGYMRYWKQNTDNTSDELLVPALVFPVVNETINNKATIRNVVVPLVEELIKQSQENYPMPILEAGIDE